MELDSVIELMVKDAVDLYINAYVNVLRIENGERTLKHPEKTKREFLDTLTEVTLFFCSDYGESLTGLDGKMVLEILKKRAVEAYNNKEEKKKYRHTRMASKRPVFLAENVK